MTLDLSKEEHMPGKFRVIKSVDSEGRKVITYIKSYLDNGNEPKSNVGEKTDTKGPKTLQMTVKLP